MSDLNKIIALGRQQVGVAEQPPGSNNVIYNTDFYGGPVNGAAYPWCCAFIWWLFNKLGLSSEFCGGAKTAYCPFVVNYARNVGAWITDCRYQPGDILLYDWNNDGIADHIGLCISWDGVKGEAIEGNTNDAVRIVTRWNSQIMGAYRPTYGNSEKPAHDAVAPDTQPTPGVDDNPDTYTVKQGDSLWLIATLHNTTIQELARINDLDPSGIIYPGQVLKLRAGPEDTPVAVLPDDVYTVRAGDSLWSIAQALLGNGWRWPKIAEANGLTMPYTIFPGQRLKIPKREG